MLRRLLMLALLCLGFCLLLGLMVVAAEDHPAPQRPLPLMQAVLVPASQTSQQDEGGKPQPCVLCVEESPFLLGFACPVVSIPMQATVSYARQQYHVFHLPDKAG